MKRLFLFTKIIHDEHNNFYYTACYLYRKTVLLAQKNGRFLQETAVLPKFRD
ncbi:MAG: hypothetical protein KC413_21810 [Anaerolineales bacterium]|nr:hypothetical protein [Anaerolineales bacterium]